MIKENQISILAIESSSKLCSVAIGIDGAVQAEYTVHQENSHDRALAELARKIVADCGLTFSELSAVAVSSGPGSFTGLRIGASLAKGICFDGETKLIAVPSLLSLANSIKGTMNLASYSEIICAIHSHKDSYYTQKFNNNFEPISSEEMIIESELLSQVNVSNLLLANELSERINNVRDYRVNRLIASYLISLAQLRYNAREFENVETFTPNYCQDFTVKMQTKK